MKRTFRTTLLIGAVAAMSAAAPAAAKLPVVSLADSIEPLRKQFNDAADRPRVVALLSPTSKAGKDGSDALASALLSGSIPDGPDVMIIWVNLMHGDTAAAADRAAARFASSSATQYYDEKGRAAWNFGAATLGVQRKGVWNTYVYYLSGARWVTEPPRPEDWLHEMAGPRAADPLRFRGGAKLRAGLKRWLGASTSEGEFPAERVRYSSDTLVGEALPPPPARKPRRRVPRPPPLSVPLASHDDYNGPFEDRESAVHSNGDDAWAQPTKSCSKSTAKPTTVVNSASFTSPNSTNITRNARSDTPSPANHFSTASSVNSQREPARPSWTNSSNGSIAANTSNRTTSSGNLLPLEPLPTNGSSGNRNSNASASSARAFGPAGFTLTATTTTPVGGKATVKTKSTAPV